MDQVEKEGRSPFATVVLLSLLLSSTLGTATAGRMLDATGTNPVVFPAMYLLAVVVTLAMPAMILIRAGFLHDRA